MSSAHVPSRAGILVSEEASKFVVWLSDGWGQGTAEHDALVRGRAPASKVGCGALWLWSCGWLLVFPLEGLPLPAEV